MPAFPQEKSAGGAVIRTTTRVVNVNLVVTDRQGNPIKNLTKDDLTLLDDGKPQPISVFSPIDNDHLLSAPPLPGPDIYTNRPAGNAAPPSVTILLFDTLNSRWSSQGTGLQRLRKFLRQIQPADHIGLYLLGDEMKVLHGFQRDASGLVAAIQRYDEEYSKSVPKPAPSDEGLGDSSLDRFLSGKENTSRLALDPSCGTAACAERQAEATQLTIASLEMIARQLAPVSGRKTLIWITDNIPGEFVENDLDEYLQQWRTQAKFSVSSAPAYLNSADIERMMRLMNGAGVAVYPVSSEGLEPADLGFRNTKAPVPNTQAVTDLQKRLPNTDAHLYMSEFASRTGGRAFLNRNDLETGIRRALDDSRFSYTLAYYPDHSKWKGEWRKIQIKVNRPDVTVLARAGYFALSDPRPLPPKNRYEFLSSIAASPIDSPQLPLAVRMTSSSGPKGPQLDTQVHMNPLAILSVQENGHWKGSFEVVFIQLDEKNKVLNVTNNDVDADIDANQYANVFQKGWTLPSHLPFAPGATQLCIILRDKLSDTVGSLHIPLARYSASLSSH
jgi:VWFA-related protein